MIPIVIMQVHAFGLRLVDVRPDHPYVTGCDILEADIVVKLSFRVIRWAASAIENLRNFTSILIRGEVGQVNTWTVNGFRGTNAAFRFDTVQATLIGIVKQLHRRYVRFALDLS